MTNVEGNYYDNRFSNPGQFPFIDLGYFKSLTILSTLPFVPFCPFLASPRLKNGNIEYAIFVGKPYNTAFKIYTLASTNVLLRSLHFICIIKQRE